MVMFIERMPKLAIFHTMIMENLATICSILVKYTDLKRLIVDINENDMGDVEDALDGLSQVFGFEM